VPLIEYPENLKQFGNRMAGPRANGARPPFGLSPRDRWSGLVCFAVDLAGHRLKGEDPFPICPTSLPA